MLVAPNGPNEPGKYAIHHNIEIPVKVCPKGPRARHCPACQNLVDHSTQLNFDEAGGQSIAAVAKARKKLRRIFNDYFTDVKKKLEKKGRYDIHKNLTPWTEMEWHLSG
jgi:hypothetical protein